MINHLRKIAVLTILLSIQMKFAVAQVEADSVRKILPDLEGEERIEALIDLASYASYNDPPQADSILLLAQTLIEELSYEKGQIRKWLVEATLSNFRSELDKSDSLVRMAIQVAEQSRDSLGLANALMTYGSLNSRRGMLAESMDHYLKSLNIARAISEFELESANLMNVGLLNVRIGDLEKAKEYLIESAEVARIHGFKFRLAQCNLNLGFVVFNMGDTDGSIRFILKALSTFTELDDQRGIAKASGNLAFAYNSLGEYDKALNYYEKVLGIFHVLQDPVEINKTRLNLAQVYASKGQIRQAIKEVEQVLETSKELEDLRVQRNAYNILLEIYEQSGNYEMALKTYKSLSITKDSIDRRADRERLSELEAKFESETKDIQLQLKNQQIELLEREGEYSKIRQYLLGLIAIVLLLLVVILRHFYIIRLRKSRLNEQLAKERSEQASRKNTRLTGELKQKSLELQQYASVLADQQEELAQLKNSLTQHDKEADITYLNEVSRSLNRRDVELLNWQDFRLKFDEVHSGFVARLNVAHPSLTSREIDLCVLLKVSVPNTEISQILEISYDGVKKAIRRTYKKMNLSSAEQLRNYILQLN